MQWNPHTAKKWGVGPDPGIPTGSPLLIIIIIKFRHCGKLYRAGRSLHPRIITHLLLLCAEAALGFAGPGASWSCSTMVSAKLYEGLGQSPQCGSGAKPLIGGQGAKPL